MLKTILFTHDDLDGAGCRIVYELAHHHLEKGKDYMVFNCPNNGADNAVMDCIEKGLIDKNTEICFGDIVASRETLEHLVNNYSMPKIWDHHRTNFFTTWVVPEAVIVPENDFGVMQSGTSLMYQHFSLVNELNVKNEKLLDKLIDTIRSYDTFEWKETNNLDAKKLNILFSLLGMEVFCNEYIARVNSDDTSDDIITDGDIKFVNAKIDYEQRIIDGVTPDDVYRVSVNGLKTAFILGGMGVNVSELAHQFLTKYPDDFDMFASFNLWRGGEFQFRTIKDDLDIGKDVAALIGGGGHPKAAGAPLGDEIRHELLKLLIMKMNAPADVDILKQPVDELAAPLQILVANAK